MFLYSKLFVIWLKKHKLYKNSFVVINYLLLSSVLSTLMNAS